MEHSEHQFRAEAARATFDVDSTGVAFGVDKGDQGPQAVRELLQYGALL